MGGRVHSSIRQAFRKYPVVFFGLLISFACGAVSLVLHASAADAFIITVVTTILPISVEILIRLGPLEQFEILSREQLQQIADNAKVHDCVKATLACYQTLAHLKGSGNAFCRQLEVAMEDHTTQLYSFSRGMFTSNLNPNNLFRESDLLAVFNSTMLATSMVDSRQYWTTSWARSYLEEQARAQTRIRQQKKDSAYAAIDRIFIEERRRLRYLVPILRAHRELDIRARVAIWEEVPEILRKDFMVIDDDVALWLTFAQGTRTAVASTLVTKEGREAHAISEYVQVFRRLESYAREPAEIPVLVAALNEEAPTV